MRIFLCGLAVAIILSAIWVIEEIRADRRYMREFRATVPAPKDRLPPA